MGEIYDYFLDGLAKVKNLFISLGLLYFLFFVWVLLPFYFWSKDDKKGDE